MTRFDVAVVGGGPGGAWSAYRLARMGARVVIFDPSHPREKPCGGGITSRALALVADALEPASLESVAIRHVQFVDCCADARADVTLPQRGHPLVVASRSRFDRLLMDAACQAGAQLVPLRVHGVTASAGGVRIDAGGGRCWHAEAIVGADGANSFTRRSLARPFRRDQLSIGTGYFAHGLTSDGIVIELAADPPGYLWSFPRPDHLAIGICAQADAGTTSAALRDRAACWIGRLNLAPGARLEPYAWPIPSLSARDFGRLDLAGPGWVLVGDAAGLVDPLTREGIFYALQSAGFAADALASDAGRAAGRYRERVHDEIAPELTRAATYRAGFFRPRFARLLLDALRRSEPVREVMADVIAGTQAYRGLRRRLARTWELRLAVKTLTQLR